jgi:CheY-like chemotaxis protein
LLFAPAFTTRAEVSETSGRGVGLDVVRTAVEEVGGTVDVTSVRGAGTTFRLTLPVTLGVVRCLVARVGAERYAVPVASVVESLSLRDVPRHAVGGAPVIMRRGTSLPLLDLGAALAVPGPRAPRVALVVRAGDRLLAWAVDGLDGELELVVKDLGSFVGRLPLLTGATIDGDGAVVCLLDLRELADRARGGGAVPMFDGVPVPSEVDSTTDLDRRRRILVVEDSVGVRELERVILEGAGYDVETAVDGVAGAARLRGEPVDLVLTDIEMPGLSGVDLTRAVRTTAGWEQVPVLVMTSRGEDADRSAGLAAGANAYLLKQDFDQEQLVQTVRRLLG